ESGDPETLPSLVDEELLQKAVEEQGPQDQAGQIAKEEGIQYDEVCQLRLDYKNILKIDHLWQFTSLTKLQLDNNIIEKIGAPSLIQGYYGLMINIIFLSISSSPLDLSFNNNEEIEGLDSLVKLEDLSLYNNRISVIENMDTLLNLHVLSIGNNFLAQLENVIYLRKFKNLRTLNLAGNPICKEDRYKIFVAAYLPELVYLDFRLLDEQTREQAFGKYQYAIEEMRHNETQERRAMDARQEQEDELQLHRDAFVELLNGPYLFDSMYADDAEAAKLAYLPGVSLLLETYPSPYSVLTVFEIGLAQRSRGEDEVKSFFDCSREAVYDNQQRAAQIAADFEKARRQVCHGTVAFTVMSRRDAANVKVTSKRAYPSSVGENFCIFANNNCRDLENHHHEKLLEIAVATLERVAKNELEEDMPDDVRMLFVDKDTVINAVSASHDTHLLKIDNREDELMMRCNSWMSALMKSVQDEEVKRNRKLISEIHNYIDYVRDHLDEIYTLPMHNHQHPTKTIKLNMFLCFDYNRCILQYISERIESRAQIYTFSTLVQNCKNADHSYGFF
uniref:Dynein regulatory complex subunit 3 n=1 Tax=Salmo trutta TaxID=8032 RepID=A0A673WW02_SALTR